MFVSKLDSSLDIVQKLADIETDLGHQGNQYIFLRSIWRTHSHLYTNTVVDLDDQLDRLNKIVGMMKKHISYSAKKELYYQNTPSYDQISVRQGRALQAMNKASLEAEEYRTRFIQVYSQNEQLKKINSDLRQQVHELKKWRKQDNKTIKQLTQKVASLQNRILQSGYEQSKSQTSFMRSSKNYQKQRENSENIKESALNVSITQNAHILSTSIEKSKLRKSRGRYSNNNSGSKWLNEESVIQNNLDESVLSISSYGFLSGGGDTPLLQRICSQQENKENFDSFRFGHHYQSQRNLLKQKSLKKNRINAVNRDLLGESPKQNLKFIRQNSKKTLLRRSQKLTDSTILNQPCK